MIRPRSTLLPTDRNWPAWSKDRQDLRRDFYARIRREPMTAAELSPIAALPIDDTVDELRILEGFGVIRHRADDLGVIRWHHRPGNAWDLPEPPF